MTIRKRIGMKLTALVENMPGTNGCDCEHGLSIYVETGKKRILVDTGASDLFCRNAQKLGIRLEDVDLLVLSHGHYDHGGGILTFSGINPNAPVYLRSTAMEAYYHPQGEWEKYIGLDPAVAALPQCIWTDDDAVIDENLSLFTNITGSRYPMKGNLQLKKKTENGFVQDSFDHEQCLVIRQDGLRVLFSGCAHHGIVNIMDQYRKRYGGWPDYVISGFHMSQKAGYSEADLQQIREIAEELKRTGAVFYTGHCTGMTAFEEMKPILGDRLRYLHCGDAVELEA